MGKRARIVLKAFGLLLFLAAVLVAVPQTRKHIKRALKPDRPVSTGRFQDPEGMCLDPEGNLFVADEDLTAIFMLDPQGTIVARVSAFPPGIMRATGGDSIVAVGPRHVVAIGDHCLLELKVEGNEFKLIRQISRRGHGEGEFEDPEGVSRDPKTGEIYASDEDHRRILVFGADGAYLRKIPVEHDPEGVTVFEDRLFVAMSKAGWVGVYALKDGSPLFRFGKGDVVEPDFVAVSPDRKLYVVDQRANRIVVFTYDGKRLFEFGGPGKEPGKFNQPEDLAFDRDGNLWVSDGDNHRIQVLTPDGKPIRVVE